LTEHRYVKITIINAFSYSGHGGSLTAIVASPSGMSEDQLASIAAQSKASHVVYISDSQRPQTRCRLRFFTKSDEIKNCAHGTTAAHWYLATQASLKQNQVLWQETMTGRQQVWVDLNNDDYLVRFAQHSVGLSPVDDLVNMNLLNTLGIVLPDLSARYQVVFASPGAKRFLLPIKSSRELHAIQPDFPRLKSLCEIQQSIGCFVYSLEGASPKFCAYGRMFAPAIGVEQDMDNGNSAGCLGAYLLKEQNQENAAIEQLDLEVFQGMAFDTLGRVKVIAQFDDQVIMTFIQGSAYYSGEELIVLRN